MLEKEIEQKVCEAARLCGWEVRKIACPGRRGFPDRMFFKHGEVFFVEFKRPGEKPRAIQSYEIEILREHGLEVFVIDNVDAGFDLLEEKG